MRARAIVVVLDAVGPEFVREAEMPRLTRLAYAGGWALAGGLAGLVASTAPGHASLLTGATETVHGVLANRLWAPSGEPTDRLVVAGPTLHGRVHLSGRKSTLCAGDPDVLNTVRGSEATHGWPFPEDVAVRPNPETGYVDDRQVLERGLAAIDAGDDFVFMQLQEPDTAAHADGIHGERSVAARRLADEAVGRVVEALGRDWDRTVLCVLSDHRAEDVVSEEPVRLAAALDGLADVIEDGSAAVMRPLYGAREAVLGAAAGCRGVAAVTVADENFLIAWAEPGRVFGREHAITTRAAHGNLTTRPTVAIVAGGHPVAARIAVDIRRSPPPLTYWANVLAEVLGV